MAPIPPAVYATLVMTDSYLPGAMVLAHSLRDHGAKAKLVALVTIDSVSATTLSELKTIYDDLVPVSQISNRSPANLYLMNRPDLISTFTKIELWKQTQYSRIVYLDADIVALRAPNELLTLRTEFAAVPDIGWPDCFNSGVLVLNPNMGDYYSLLALAQRGISFDGADQGLLNMHFRDWERLSFTYNCTPSGNYQYVPAYRHFQSSINLIHFIGPDKPWVLGRHAKQSSGVYDELLGRWWAVYDKHYRPKTAQFSGQSSVQSTVPNHVKGEAYSMVYGYSSQAPMIQVQPPYEPQISQVAAPSSEEPLADQPDLVDSIQTGNFEPTPTVEQRRFSAPLADWDAARAPPPQDSKPEAANFPTQTYTMSSDKNLFEAPAKYPEPPKDMWYQVPPKSPKQEKLAPLFPWETRAPKPTRVFPQEAKAATPPESEPEPEPTPEPTAAVSTSIEEPTPTDSKPAVPTLPKEEDPWLTYTRTNAWDEMPEINRYVQSVQQNRRGKVQVLQSSSRTPGTEPLLSPAAEDRRPSLRLTDFPTEVERPSLPVTPAPIRRPSFWGEERDEQGELPAAPGVPKQEDWVSNTSVDQLSVLSHAFNFVWRCQFCGKQNPVVRLEELQRRQSELLDKSPQTVPDPPKREMPESASKEAAEAAADNATSSRSAPTRPTFTEPDFGSSTQRGPSSGQQSTIIQSRA